MSLQEEVSEHNVCPLPLSKQPTEWLDSNDRLEVEMANISSRDGDRGSTFTNLEEIRISSPSHGSAPANSEDNTETIKDTVMDIDTLGMDGNESTSGDTRDISGISGVFSDPDMSSSFSYVRLGESHVIGARTLIFVRLLFVFLNAITIGFVYGMRNEVPLRALLTEISMWMHIILLFLGPVLVLSATLTMAWRAYSEADPPDVSPLGQFAWCAISALFQVITVLSQVELIRLVMLHFLAAGRPAITQEDPSVFFSLSNAFAFQRYVLVLTTVADVIVSTVPFRTRNIILTSFISLIWELAMFFARPVGNGIAVRLLVLLCIEGAVLILGKLNVFIWNSFSHRFKRRREESITFTTVV